jgi:hypothetical protein
LSYVIRRFAISRPALDGGIPFLFKVSKGISVQFVVKGAEIWKDCDGSGGRWGPFQKVEIACGTEKEVLESN